jgi:hypothetical protein
VASRHPSTPPRVAEARTGRPASSRIAGEPQVKQAEAMGETMVDVMVGLHIDGSHVTVISLTVS